MSNLKKYRKSLTIIAIVLILMLLAMYQSAFADEPFQPVMPETLTILGPSGMTTGSNPNIDISRIASQHWHNGPNGSPKSNTVSQIQIVVSSATTTYYNGWHSVPTHPYLKLTLNIPIGTEYVVSIRGWNNNGFGEWTVSGLNTVVAKGTDCWSNPMRYDEATSQWIDNPACQ